MQKAAPSFGRVAVMAAFALSCFGLLLFLWLAFGGTIPIKPKGYRFTASFAEATQLAQEADVRISGVPVGKVKTIEPDKQTGRTDVVIQLDSRYAPLRSDARAILRQKTLLGETYVELTPGSPKAKAVPEGGTLRASQVSPTVELDEIYRSFDPPTRRAFQVWMQTQAQAVKGHGRDINDALGNLGPFAEDASVAVDILNRQEGAVRRLISNTGVVFGALTERGDQLRELIENSNRVFARVAPDAEPPRPLRGRHEPARHPAAPGGAGAVADAHRPLRARPRRQGAVPRPRQGHHGLAHRLPRRRADPARPAPAARPDRPGAAPGHPHPRVPRRLQGRADRLLRQHRGGDAGARPRHAPALPAHDEPAQSREPRRLSAPHRLEPPEPVPAARRLP